MNSVFDEGKIGFVYWDRVLTVLKRHRFENDSSIEFRMARAYYEKTINTLCVVNNQLMSMALLRDAGKEDEIKMFSSTIDLHEITVSFLLSLFPFEWIEQLKKIWTDEEKLGEHLQVLLDDACTRIANAFSHEDEWNENMEKIKKNVDETELETIDKLLQ